MTADFGTTQTQPRTQPTSRRRRGAVAVVFCVIALVASLVFVAVNAEGRDVSRASANDGGAWVVSRKHGAVAHQNRATGELSTFVRMTDSPTVEMHQSSDLVLVHDPVANQLLEIDPRSASEDAVPTQLPEFTRVEATDGAAMVVRQDPIAVWRISSVELGAMTSLDSAPMVEATGAGVVGVAPMDQLVVVEAETGLVHWFDAGQRKIAPTALDLSGTPISASIIDASVVVLSDAGELVVLGTAGVEHRVDLNSLAPGTSPALVERSWVQPNPSHDGPATSVFVITANGELVQVTLGIEATVSVTATLGGENPLQPIRHRGCVYAVMTVPPTYGAACEAGVNDGRTVTRPIVGASSQLRLRLVNDWIWINDVESGATYSPNAELELEVLDDWGPVIDAASDEDDDEELPTSQPQDSDDAEIIDDPDADGDAAESDRFDPSKRDEPPIAVDDEAETRVERVTVVDVLANDRDPNNDPLAVVEVELLEGEAVIDITPSGAATQVSPAAGFTGTVRYRYAITDGKNAPVSAIVTVQVLGRENNRDPVPVTDVISTTAGQPQIVDVLANDGDPDGDALFLANMTAPSGDLRWDPSGVVTYTPDTSTELGWIEIPYFVADGFGGEAEGRLRVEIRDDGANQEPDARNDLFSTVVGRRVSGNLLANDSDPDGDPLIVGSEPRLLSPEGADPRTSTTSDGEFVFEADAPGTYLFAYTINDTAGDGSESDTAQIRVDVQPDVGNTAPIAVRDDIVIPIGETRSVRVLDNDSDFDGDVIAIVDWSVSPGLIVTELLSDRGQVGFDITVTDAVAANPEVIYSISDGVNPPVSAPVVVVVAERKPTNQPPFANDDIHEGRSGQTFEIPVLTNDFDPEGDPLNIVAVGETDQALVSISEDGQTIIVSIPEDAVSSFTVPYDIEDVADNRAAAILRVQPISPSAANRPPVARVDLKDTRIGTAVVVDVLANDSDPDSDPIVLAGIVEQPVNGSTQPNPDGTVLYVPDSSFRGTDVFVYRRARQ